MSGDLSENPKETIVSVPDNSEVKRSNGAKRAAKFRQLKKKKGLVPVDLPIAVAKEIKAAGSFEIWFKQFQRTPSDQTMKRISIALKTAAKVSNLHPLKRWILDL